MLRSYGAILTPILRLELEQHLGPTGTVACASTPSTPVIALRYTRGRCTFVFIALSAFPAVNFTISRFVTEQSYSQYESRGVIYAPEDVLPLIPEPSRCGRKTQLFDSDNLTQRQRKAY